jgi:hypothetical protein
MLGHGMPCPNNTPRTNSTPCTNNYGTLLDSVSCRKALLNTDRLDLQAPNRRALDEVVFDVLGLTAGEREAVYEAVVNLVRARLEKARSV